MNSRIGKGTYKKISLHKSWVDFDNFYNDMYDSYCEHVSKFGEEKTSIDRINNNLDYSKENCRWATPEEQANNRSNNRYLTFKGETLTISQWSRKLNISRQGLSQRLRDNWSLERALTPTQNPITKLDLIIKDVSSGKFGTKNKVELLLRLESLKVK